MCRHASSFLVVLGLLSAAGLAQAQSMTPVGLWKTIDDDSKQERSLIRISETAGVYTGKLEKLLDPDARPDKVCTKCSDDRKDKPLLGMTLIRNVKRADGEQAMWDGGEILDPENGKTYKVRLVPVDGGKKLTVRGYIGTPMLGRTQTWLRIE